MKKVNIHHEDILRYWGDFDTIYRIIELNVDVVRNKDRGEMYIKYHGK